MPSRREAKLDGVTIDLTRKEYDLLLFLAQRPGEVVTKREMLAEVWRQPYGGALHCGRAPVLFDACLRDGGGVLASIPSEASG